MVLALLVWSRRSKVDGAKEAVAELVGDRENSRGSRVKKDAFWKTGMSKGAKTNSALAVTTHGKWITADANKAMQLALEAEETLAFVLVFDPNRHLARFLLQQQPPPTTHHPNPKVQLNLKKIRLHFHFLIKKITIST